MSQAKLLPAKLTPIEEYFLADDCPGFPMIVLIRLRFSGPLNRTAFEAAVAEVVERNPLLRAVVDSKSSNLSWRAVEAWLPSVEWDAEFSRDEWPQAKYVDVRQEPGTRFWVSKVDGCDEVVIQAHHCCSDAMGMCRLTEDLLIAYDHYAADAEAKGTKRYRDICWRRFRRRSTPAIPAWLFTMMAHRWVARFRDCMQILRCECCRLFPRSHSNDLNNGASVRRYPSLTIMRFDRAQTERIVSSSRRSGTTVNSILLRDLYQTIRDWRSRAGFSRRGDRIRFCVPVNLRTKRDHTLPVTNALSLLFLDRDEVEMQCSESLLAGIHDEVHGTGRKDLRMSFVTMLRVSRNLPGGIKRWLDPDKCWATCLFSNLGVLFKDSPVVGNDGQLAAGGLRLESWDLVPPLRNNMGVTVCPYSYAGRLSIVIHYDSSRMDPSQLADIASAYRSNIEQNSQIDAEILAAS